jgi:methionyl-tRNA formyltransferase
MAHSAELRIFALPKLRIAFMGTPDFSVPALKALLDAGHEVVCVYSQPPRPAGRGHETRKSPVHLFAESRGIAVRTPERLKSPDEHAAFKALNLDVAVVVAYGLILPKPILDAPRLGCLNIHASLLPRWRGAAPIQRAIMAGDRETGVMVMRMDEGLDTGPVLMTERIAIPERATAGWLHDRLAELGADLIPRALEAYASGKLEPQSQPADGATYAKKITAEETRIDWSKSAIEVDRIVRGLSPVPGAWSNHGDERLKILMTQVSNGVGAPGTLLDDALTVACGDGAIKLIELQRSGRAPASAQAFLRGYKIARGERLT